MTDPADLRRTYDRGTLDDGAVADTWLEQFRRWFDAAVADPAVPEANAMQVATIDAGGRPQVRTVLLKGLDERGVVFFTNYDSAKGRALAANPYAAAVLLWHAHERQVRVSGPVARVSAAETEAYFHSRPRGSQVGAWASPQSEVIASRAELEAREREIAERFGDGEIPVPPFWGGFRITPEQVEFWQGRPDRLHDRIRYVLDGADWRRERLAP
ncbi:MAG: pyridoxamine 5'-phosphate oxidase [Jatrophihabitans sp.]|uniref:pyridoxamine 5'-phosphate oxidase n=1 Tax=Jatrophihabitans sp. TaxID=1932789 RepID=UPI003F7E4BB8